MNKKGLVSIVMKKTGATREDAGNYVNAVLDSVKECLASGNDLMLTGFGSFSLRQRKARKGRNPATGEPVDIPEYKTVTFRPGKELRNTVNR